MAPAALPGPVVGLVDRDGFCPALGVLLECGADRRRPEPVARVRSGRLRLTRAGGEKNPEKS